MAAAISVAVDDDDPFADTDEPQRPSENAAQGLLLDQLVADPAPAQPEKPLADDAAKLLERHLKIKPQNRQPGTVLQALAAQAQRHDALPPAGEEGSPDDEQAAKDVAGFSARIAMGDWGAVKRHIARLPAAIQPEVYNHVLEMLSNADVKVILLPGEIFDLADAAPQSLTPRQLTTLGELLHKSLHFAGRPQDLMGRLQTGTARLGGTDIAKRLAAARLLLAAGLPQLVEPFLPAPEKTPRELSGELICLMADYQQLLANRSRDPLEQLKAWNLAQAVIADESISPVLHTVAIARSLELVPKVPAEIADPWLDALFHDHPERGILALARLANKSPKAGRAAPPLDPAALQMQQRVVGRLLAVMGQDRERWQTALDMLTAAWIEQAEQVLGTNSERVVSQIEYTITHSSMGRSRTTRTRREPQVPATAAADVLAAGPDDAWRGAIHPDLAQRARQLTGLLAARAGDEKRVLAEIDAALPDNPEHAHELAELYLQGWTQRVANGGEGSVRRHFGHSPQDGQGISLTRARQVRNLGQLATLWAELKSRAALPAVDAETAVAALAACHSPAETYRLEDLELVFGPLAGWTPAQSKALVENMREKLVAQWRNPQLQDQAGTHRTDEELVAEVERGYALASRLLDAAAEQTTPTADDELLRGRVTFDQAEFAYGQQAELAKYTALRDQAFAAFRRAAESYAATLEHLPTEKQSAEAFLTWYQAALGASDLAYMLPNDRTDHDQIEQLHRALEALPADHRDNHLKLFGEAVVGSANQVPPQLKPRYYREAARVLADHASGEPLRQLLAHYDELLAEIRLHLAVDGSAEVGHDEPFGVRLSIRSTVPMAREGDRFGQILQSLQPGPANQVSDGRKKLEQELHDKLDKNFEIKSIRYHDPATLPRGFGQEGWVEMPLAYLLLRAKDAAVDRLPPLQFDMQFSDAGGDVLLPIGSQVELIDATRTAPPQAPAELKIKQTFDDRRLSQDAARLEITATAQGLIGPLASLIDFEENLPAGFRVRSVVDQGLEVGGLDATSRDIKPLCERTWVAEFEPLAGAQVDTFAFPAPLAASAVTSYERYVDADLTECDPTVSLSHPIAPGRLWQKAAVGLALLALAALVAAVWHRRRTAAPQSPAQNPFRRPARLTPFNLVVLLRKIKLDAAALLSPAESQELSQTIADLERRHFGRGTDTEPNGELEPTLDRWLARVAPARQSAPRLTAPAGSGSR